MATKKERDKGILPAEDFDENAGDSGERSANDLSKGWEGDAIELQEIKRSSVPSFLLRAERHENEDESGGDVGRYSRLVQDEEDMKIKEEKEMDSNDDEDEKLLSSNEEEFDGLTLQQGLTLNTTGSINRSAESSSEKNSPGAITPLPIKKVAAVCVVVVSQSICASILFPFVGFMVEDLGETSSREEVGYYAGYLASAYFLAQVVSGYPWGYLSDTCGRRPVLLFGSVGSACAILLFGFSTSYPLALFYRMLSGLLDSTVPAIKAYLGDITDNTNKAQGFSFYGLSWGIGSIVGPVVGGLLAQPTLKYPEFFDPDGLFGKFPYLLPCLVSFILGVTALLISLVALPESKQWVDPKVQGGIVNEGQGQRYFRHVVKLDDGSGESVEFNWTELEKVMVIEKRKKRREEMKEDETKNGEKEREKDRDVEEQLIEQEQEEEILEKMNRLSSAQLVEIEEVYNENVASMRSFVDNDEELGMLDNDWRRRMGKGIKPRLSSFIEKLRTYKSLIGAISAYLLTCLVFVGSEEVFPLWCMADIKNGGLAYNTSNIGGILLGGGIALLTFQAFFYYRITRVIGIRTTLIGALLLGGFFTAMIPSANIFRSIFFNNEHYTGVWVFIYLEMLIVLKTCCGTCCFTSTNIFVNLSAPNAVGRANGIAFMLAGFVKALGPSVGTNLLAWSLTNSLPFPFDYHLVFLLLGLMSGMGVAVCLLIDPELEKS